MSLRVEVKLCRENTLRGCLLEEGETYAGRNQGKKRSNCNWTEFWYLGQNWTKTLCWGIVKQRRVKLEESCMTKEYMMDIRSLSWSYNFHFDLNVNPSNLYARKPASHTKSWWVSLLSRNYRKWLKFCFSVHALELKDNKVQKWDTV